MLLRERECSCGFLGGLDGAWAWGEGWVSEDGGTATVACVHGVVVMGDVVDDTVAHVERRRDKWGGDLRSERVIAVELRDIRGCVGEKVDVSPEGVATVSTILTTLGESVARLVASWVARVGVEIASHEGHVLRDPPCKGSRSTGTTRCYIARKRRRPAIPPGGIVLAVLRRHRSNRREVRHRGGVGQDIVQIRIRRRQHAVTGEHGRAARMSDNHNPLQIRIARCITQTCNQRIIHIH